MTERRFCHFIILPNRKTYSKNKFGIQLQQKSIPINAIYPHCIFTVFVIWYLDDFMLSISKINTSAAFRFDAKKKSNIFWIGIIINQFFYTCFAHGTKTSHRCNVELFFIYLFFELSLRPLQLKYEYTYALHIISYVSFQSDILFKFNPRIRAFFRSFFFKFPILDQLPVVVVHTCNILSGILHRHNSAASTKYKAKLSRRVTSFWFFYFLRHHGCVMYV